LEKVVLILVASLQPANDPRAFEVPRLLLLHRARRVHLASPSFAEADVFVALLQPANDPRALEVPRLLLLHRARRVPGLALIF
jgi:hypothetical protein